MSVSMVLVMPDTMMPSTVSMVGVVMIVSVVIMTVMIVMTMALDAETKATLTIKASKHEGNGSVSVMSRSCVDRKRSKDEQRSNKEQ